MNHQINTKLTLLETDFNRILTELPRVGSVMVLGDIGIDKYTYGSVKRISPEAPVAVVEVEKEWMKLGLAANVSDNFACLGVQSTLCGVIGDDHHGKIMEDLLDDIRVKTWGIVRDSSRQTTFKERVMTAIQQICRVDYETKKPVEQNIQQKMYDRLCEFSKEHKALIIEDYGKGALSEKLIQDSIQLFQREGKIVAIDPSRTTPAHWYRGANLFKPNLQEAITLLQSQGHHFQPYTHSGGELDLEQVSKMARTLQQELDFNQVVITLGAHGMALCHESQKFELIPTAAREVYDVSGAGDTTIVALVSALLGGGTLEQAAWFANCAAGVVVGKKGTATVSEVELRDFYFTLRGRL